MAQDNEAGGAPRGRPRSQEKRDAILAAAADLFLELGPANCSMDAVANQAGVSKQTVYSHFGDKETLFTTCIEHKVSGYRVGQASELTELSLADGLTEFGARFIGLLCDSQVIGMHRAVFSAAASHPEIALLFYRSGPERAIKGLASLLRHHAGQGALRVDDPEEAAMLFMDMLAGHLNRQLVLGVAKPPGAKARNRRVAITVERFLALFGT